MAHCFVSITWSLRGEEPRWEAAKETRPRKTFGCFAPGTVDTNYKGGAEDTVLETVVAVMKMITVIQFCIICFSGSASVVVVPAVTVLDDMG